MPRFLLRLSASAWLLLALAGAARAEPATYALDPVHTRILVAVDHAGFSTALGTISGSTGRLRFTPGEWADAEVTVEIPLQRLDFGDEEWNRATLARGLLDAGTHPVATFRSTRVEPLDEQRAVVHGVLDLRGVSRDVALEVTLNGARRHPLPPFRRTVGFSATATLSRADFGITAWRSMIGDTVQLRIEAEATRVRDRDGADGAEAGDAPTAPAPDRPASDDPTPVPEPEPIL
ncbi:YceI family protein [Luteimonas sp. SDU101]|uniref:YceI family protein n=1 Tax=Luteimonas sp. SDU101 TaxID=3422593 RepID=UPI003EB761DE